MIPLDIRTMMVMTALLALMMAGQLLLASIQRGNPRGLRLWALAQASIGLAFGLALPEPRQPLASWLLVGGSALIVLGLALQWQGLRSFYARPCLWWPILLSLGLALLGNLWFAIIAPNVLHRAIFNSSLMGTWSLLCAHAALRPPDTPPSIAARLTGAAFLGLALLFFVRLLYLLTAAPPDYGLYARISLNPIMQFLLSVLQMILVSGFMLMVHTRITNDLHHLASSDGLTGARNRRSLEERFARWHMLEPRKGGILSLLLIDIDHFKHVNDTYGHPAGDAVLCAIARLGQTMLRKHDTFARYGGEEFCVLLPATNETEAASLAERFRLAVAAHVHPNEDPALPLTIRIGVACSNEAGKEFAPLLQAADDALYHAKRNGRNRVVAFSSLP
jgi:diguanylate cyclase (GGDEF)-like protein